MTLQIHLPSELEAVIRERAIASGIDVETYVLNVMKDDVIDELPSPPRGESTEAFMSRLREMVLRHAVRSGHVDDSRESIYAGCGE